MPSGGEARMSITDKRRLIGLTGLILWVLSSPGQAIAQSDVGASSDKQSPGANNRLDEIVVTARRLEERELDVPIAMTVASAEQLDLQGAADITALQRTTPNLTLQVSRGTNSTLTAFIRGIGQQDPLWGFEPGVGLYVDDIYIARPQGAVLDVFDIERIEVLRGPQGTLYGRNTIGGTVKYVTRRMGDDPTLKFRGEIGTESELNAIVAGSAPVSERFRVGAAVARYSRDGFGKNLTLNKEHANRDSLAARISAEWEPSDTLFFRLSADSFQDDSNINNGHRETPVFPTGEPPLDSVYDTLSGIGYEGRVRTSGASLTGEWQTSETLTLKSITAYREGDTRGDGIDFDGLPDPFFDIPGFYDDDQFSQEIQAQFDVGKISGVVGAYYMDSTAAGAFHAVLGLLGFTQTTSGSVDTESVALFGDANFEINDRFSASVGLRWTRDEKEGAVFKANYPGVGVPAASATPFAILTDYTNQRSFSEVTPRLSLSYKMADNLNLYTAYGRGFKSGGFDMRGDASVTPATMNGYDPEIVDSYEVGFKSFLLDNRLRLNGAAFHAQYQGQQVTTQVPVGTSAVSFVDNAGESRINGAELEGTAQLSDWLSANFAVGYIDAEFDKYASFVAGAPGNGFPCIDNPPSPPSAIGCYADVSDQRVFQNTPEWSGFFGFHVFHELSSGGRLDFNANVSFRSSVNLFETPIPALDQGGYELIDLSAVWTSENDRWRVGLHGRNLSDEEYKIGGYNFPVAFFGDSVVSFYGQPRTIELTTVYRF